MARPRGGFPQVSPGGAAARAPSLVRRHQRQGRDRHATDRRYSKAKDHAKSAGELRAALGARREAASAEKALRELITIKGDVEYGTTLITLAKAEPLVRRAQTLVKLAKQIVRPGY
jgi:hypothetical protein